MHRKVSAPVLPPGFSASHPSQGDILEMIDTSSRPKMIEPVFAEPSPVKPQPRSIEKKVQPEYVDASHDNHVPDNQNIDVTFSRADYDQWLSKIKAKKFNTYLAWFDVNIK